VPELDLGLFALTSEIHHVGNIFFDVLTVSTSQPARAQVLERFPNRQ
jgi:hypothetical protein